LESRSLLRESASRTDPSVTKSVSRAEARWRGGDADADRESLFGRSNHLAWVAWHTVLDRQGRASAIAQVVDEQLAGARGKRRGDVLIERRVGEVLGKPELAGADGDANFGKALQKTICA